MFERVMEEWAAVTKAEMSARNDQARSTAQLHTLLENAMAPEFVANRAVLIELCRIVRKLDPESMQQLEEKFKQQANDTSLEKSAREVARKTAQILAE